MQSPICEVIQFYKNAQKFRILFYFILLVLYRESAMITMQREFSFPEAVRFLTQILSLSLLLTLMLVAVLAESCSAAFNRTIRFRLKHT
jgi:hypothetical protein